MNEKQQIEEIKKKLQWKWYVTERITEPRYKLYRKVENSYDLFDLAALPPRYARTLLGAWEIAADIEWRESQKAERVVDTNYGTGVER
jgi:hypothetical protein